MFSAPLLSSLYYNEGSAEANWLRAAPSQGGLSLIILFITPTFHFLPSEIYQNLSVVDDFHNILALIGINFVISVLWLNTVSKGTESKYVFLVCHLELKIPVDFSIQHSLRKKKTPTSVLTDDFNFSWELTKDLGCSNF